MPRSSFSSKVVGFCLAALGLAACQAVAGIEDRKLDPNAFAPPATQQCKDYCADVMDACAGADAVYTSLEFCLGVCALLDPGDEEDTNNNTVACRDFYARDAKREPDSCKAAGPGGNGVCGSDCEAYCQLYPQACPDDYKYGSSEDCLKFCNTLPEQKTFDVVRDHGGDTVECRLVHVSSATTKPGEHCPHAQIPPTEPWCINDLTQPPTCEDYCSIELAACDGKLRQYESQQQCLDVCAALTPGTNKDEAGNTLGCRRYHSFSASTLPETHCYHSGPTGDGHCGDPDTGNCESYCQLLAAACPKQFSNEMVDADSCVKACVDLPEAGLDSKYTLPTAEKSTGLKCRVLHTVRAFEDPGACASAMGRDQCAP